MLTPHGRRLRSLFKLRVADQPDWEELYQSALRAGAAAGSDARAGGTHPLLCWTPNRRRYQAIWPQELARARIRLEDILSGGGQWVKANMPQLW